MSIFFAKRYNKYSITTTTIIEITGTTIASKLIINELPISAVAINGFAIPNVVVEDATRVVAVVPEMAAAVPPPAIIAKLQVITSGKSTSTAAITIVPAIAANGTAIVSNTLSIKGTKYAKSSIIVAIANSNNALKLPIHANELTR